MTAANNDKAKWAETAFERLEELDKNRSRLRVQIFTGRTHQIRVHMSSINFPILGDVLYGGPKSKRVMLHACELRFKDPDNDGAEVVVQSEAPF